MHYEAGYDEPEAATSSYEESSGMSRERDEVGEVKKMTLEETNRVRLWRILVSVCLVMTGVAITATTYRFLADEQESNFKVAFKQFSRTLSDSAAARQRFLREGLKGFTDAITASVIMSNETWPFVTLPMFEAQARHFRQLIGCEAMGFNVRISESQRSEWIAFTTEKHESLVRQGHMIQKGNIERLNPVGYKPFISTVDPKTGEFLPVVGKEMYLAMWMYSPPPATYGMINVDFNSFDHSSNIFKGLESLRNQTLIGPVRPFVTVPLAMSQEEHDAMHSVNIDSSSDHPHSIAWHAVHEKINEPSSPIVALQGCGIAWDFALRNLLPETVSGIIAVIENTCGQVYTYKIDGRDAFFLGEGDFHTRKYDDMRVTVDLTMNTHSEFKTTPGHCMYNMHLYPSDNFKEKYSTNTPLVFAILVALSFAIVIIVFFVYDMHVERRNKKVIMNAAHSNSIVSSLFPGPIRDRLINQDDNIGLRSNPARSSANLKSFLSKGGDLDAKSKPLAEFFLETTVMFADIVGFTAWSSVREPSQVFTLLETVYAEFDAIAAKRRVYKVETVGDCYVAVTGLPEPRKDHAVIMARFARDILQKMNVITKELEKTLGPDTAELSLRIGIHSGPVTAGVLRGERARFQLFGDTMNTCARMESTSEPGMIHLSVEAANELIKSGKGKWFYPRADKVYAKGKGELETFFLYISSCIGSDQQSSLESAMQQHDDSEAESVAEEVKGQTDRKSRLIEWNVEKLVDILRLIIARRESSTTTKTSQQGGDTPVDDSFLSKYTTPLEEVKEIIILPAFDSKVAKMQRNPDTVVVPSEVVGQIRDYITCIASMYRTNPFHNFDHASHVVMSVTKLLSRIVAPTDLPGAMDNNDDVDGDGEVSAATLHDHTYGITSDPLTQFSCAWSALIHDVDHTGVPNTQLIEENKTLAILYNHRSVAEQNSLDLSWKLFMDTRYAAFRKILCPTVVELQRFRQLVVNCVMATDIMDKDLKDLRNKRWERAFSSQVQEQDRDDLSPPTRSSKKHQVDRKATIVIEHLIQASDVAHTMQHWHVYRKWNENLFREMYKAYQDGRAAKDPTEFWYNGEIGFLDYYVIPLAKKLKDCGVFGISSDEYLSYASGNRAEWERRGKEIVAQMVERIRKEGV